MVGAATQYDLSAVFVRDGGTTSSDFSEDRKHRVGLCVINSSRRYEGDSAPMTRCVIDAILYSMRFSIGSQCRRFSSGAELVRRGTLQTTRARLFWTR